LVEDERERGKEDSWIWLHGEKNDPFSDGGRNGGVIRSVSCQILLGGPFRPNWPPESISACRQNCDVFFSLSLSPILFQERKRKGIQNDKKINLTKLVRKRVVELCFLLSFHLVCFMKINRIDRIVLFVLKIAVKLI